MTIKEIVSEKNARFNTVPDKFLSEVDKVQKKIFVELLSLVNSLEQKNGAFATTYKNLSRVAVLIEDLRDSLSAGEYPTIVQSFIDEFANQKFLNDQYFTKSFPDFKKSSFADAVLKKSQSDARQALMGSPIDSKFLQPIESLLTDAISVGAPWKNTILNIRDVVEGNEEIDGSLLSHSKTISHDAFAVADRAYQAAVNDELSTEWFLYSGGEISATRCFCKERHEKYFHRREVEAWGNGQDLGDCKDKVGLWDGANENTNSKNIFLYVGGWGCRHSLLGVSVFSVPIETIRRNLENKYYTPDEAEREAVGV